MATRKPEVIDLHEALAKEAPIVGVSRKGKAIRIDYDEAATIEQKLAAEAVAAGWDWKKEVERELTVEERFAALEAEVANLAARYETLLGR